MRRISGLLSIFAVGLLVGCNYRVTEQRSVELPGSAPLEEKVALAQRVATALLGSGLHDKIRARYPSVTDDQLRGLDLRWRVFSGSEISLSGSKPVQTFYLQCAITLPRSDETTKTILEYCKSLLEEELARAQAPSESA